MTYTELEKTIDRLEDKRKTWPMGKPFIIFFISGSYIISTFL
jgi:hypothetical protein